MTYLTPIIFGGCGFVGSNIAELYATTFPQARVIVVDNLTRRGSELSIARLRDFGIQFIHADIRSSTDLELLPECDLLIDCAAEPSVHAGANSSPRYVLETNLMGTINALEVARKRNAAFLFLSTSRVYPISALNAIPFKETSTRFAWMDSKSLCGYSASGVCEDFQLQGARSFYGASKLSSEMIVAEYADSYGLRTLVNRCGVLTGPWQFAKVDQGVVALWVARHYFGLPLRYVGFGGTGKQVRDVLHVKDLFSLIKKQLTQPGVWDGRVYNVGGGLGNSTSLLELTTTCQSVMDRCISIGSVTETSNLDIRVFLMNTARAQEDFGWHPSYTVSDSVSDIAEWISDNESVLKPIFCS